MTPLPDLSQSHCSIPTALAVALFECYFGNGPRHREPRPSPSPSTAPVDVYAKAAQTDPEGGGREQFLRAVNRLQEWTPRGVAAPTPPPPAEGEVQSGHPGD